LYIIGTGFISIGALLVGFYGVIPEQNHSLDDLMWLYKQSGFIIYFTFLELLIFSVMFVTHYIEYRINQIEIKDHQNDHKRLYGYTINKLKKYVGIRQVIYSIHGYLYP
jgi:hypothetical protein